MKRTRKRPVKRICVEGNKRARISKQEAAKILLTLGKDLSRNDDALAGDNSQHDTDPTVDNHRTWGLSCTLSSTTYSLLDIKREF